MGAGVVGGALVRYFESRRTGVAVYDPPKDLGSLEDLNAASMIFVCVPTPYTPGVGFDDSHLLEAVRSLEGSKIAVIKSTVLPGTTDLLQQRFPQHRFLFSPEFLREATAYQDFTEPDRQVVGFTDRSEPDAVRVMALLPRAPLEKFCPAAEAEMAKYVANAFLAVKVSYANEVFDLCGRLGIDYAGVRDIAGADARIGTSHMDVLHSGYRGYGGKCLPKDTRALLDLARTMGAPMDVLLAADRANARLCGESELAAANVRAISAERAA